MVEYFKEEVEVDMAISDVMATIKSNKKNDWQILFENVSGDEQGELVFLSGMFSGAGALALMSHGARKALIFIKLISVNKGTKVIVITGGSESLIGIDFGRHRKNVESVFGMLGLKPIKK